MTATDQLRYGSKPWRWDPRERGFSHSKYFGAANLALLPREGLKRARRPVENQLTTLRCTGYAAAVANGYIHSLRFHPDYQAKKIGQQQRRNVDISGADPKAAMKSLIEDGSLLIDLWPLMLEKDGADRTGQWTSYPDNLDEKAKDNRALAYLGVDDAFDYFDDIRYALYKAYNPKTGKGAVVQAFGAWYAEWSNPAHTPIAGTLIPGIVPTNYQAFAGYHAYLFVDWCEIGGKLYLVAQNSAGTLLGDQGFLYLPREVVNREFAKWGTALKILKPMTPEQIALAKQESPAGRIQRLIIQAWYLLSDKFGAFGRLFARYA